MIEAVSNDNINDVLPLIREYQTFYKVDDICEKRNRAFFSQFGYNNSQGCQFIYKDKQHAIAFATVYFSFSSTIAAKVAVLNDVYTQPNYRGKDIARELIEHCRKYAKENNAVRLQWVTAQNNEQAKKLYDSLDTNQSTWDFYTYPVE